MDANGNSVGSTPSRPRSPACRWSRADSLPARLTTRSTNGPGSAPSRRRPSQPRAPGTTRLSGPAPVVGGAAASASRATGSSARGARARRCARSPRPWSAGEARDGCRAAPGSRRWGRNAAWIPVDEDLQRWIERDPGPCASTRDRVVPGAPLRGTGRARLIALSGPPQRRLAASRSRVEMGGILPISLPSRTRSADPAFTATGLQVSSETSPSPTRPTTRPRCLAWAELLRRVFAVDVLACPRCGGRMRVLAAIHPPEATRSSRASHSPRALRPSEPPGSTTPPKKHPTLPSASRRSSASEPGMGATPPRGR